MPRVSQAEIVEEMTSHYVPQAQVLPLQGWKIFISYRNPDLREVERLAYLLELNGAEVQYWERDKLPGIGAWEVIQAWVQWCNCVIVVVTRNTLADSLPVGEEVGMAIQRQKLILPLVEKGIDSRRLGALQDIIRIEFNRSDPWRPIQEIGDALMRHAASQQPQLWRGLAILAGILGGLWLMGRGEEE